VKELQSLGLNVEVFTDDDQQVVLADDAAGDTLSELEGINLSGFEADERDRI
jgi:DNA-directed RNA polymerase subunit beta